MPRPLRIFDPGSLVHVISRASQGEAIFSEAEERGLFVKRLAQQAHAWDGRIYAYVVMGNHFHLLLEVGKQPLQTLMHPLLTWYSGRYNWQHDRRGHVFQGRYQTVLLQREAHLLELVRYLHLNPVRAGLVRSPEEYTWSSHSAYCAGSGHGWLAVEQALRVFSDDRRSAIRQYREFVHDGISMGRRPEWYRSSPLGKHLAGGGRAARRARGVLALAQRLALSGAEINPGEAATVEARVLLAHVAVVAAGLSVAEVAEALGCHATTVQHDLRKAQDLRKRSPHFRQRLIGLLRGFGA